MKKIFTNEKLGINDIFFLDKEDYNHIVNSLRSKINDSFVIGDSENREFIGNIVEITKNSCKLKIVKEYIRNKKNKKHITLYFPLLKKDNTEIILEKCTELGVNHFIPYISQNTICKPENIEKKLIRWRAIVKEASQQSLREIIPSISLPVNIKDIQIEKNNSLYILSHMEGENILKIKDKIDSSDNIFIIVGPEGDFSSEEIKFLQNRGFISCKISENILKSETSCISIVSIIMSLIL